MKQNKILISFSMTLFLLSTSSLAETPNPPPAEYQNPKFRKVARSNKRTFNDAKEDYEKNMAEYYLADYEYRYAEEQVNSFTENLDSLEIKIKSTEAAIAAAKNEQTKNAFKKVLNNLNIEKGNIGSKIKTILSLN